MNGQHTGDDRLHVIVRPMRMTDIDQVLDLDKVSFPSPWPRRVYQHEISNTDRARMFVLEPGDVIPHTGTGNGHRSSSNSWLDRFLAKRQGDPGGTPIIGYSGYWHIGGESHISTIAVAPGWRGYKLGELLIWFMVRQAFREKAQKLTLEVRVSNEVAKNLYRKYGFEVYGRRKGYYSDNGEDAFNMGVSPLDESYRQLVTGYGKELSRTIRVTDRC